MLVKKVEFHNGEVVNFVHMNGVKSGTLKKVITEVTPPIAIVDDGENVHKIEIDKIIKVETEDKAKVEKSEDPETPVNPEDDFNGALKPVEFPVDRGEFMKIALDVVERESMTHEDNRPGGGLILFLTGVIIADKIADAIYGPEGE